MADAAYADDLDREARFCSLRCRTCPRLAKSRPPGASSLGRLITRGSVMSYSAQLLAATFWLCKTTVVEMLYP